MRDGPAAAVLDVVQTSRSTKGLVQETVQAIAQLRRVSSRRAVPRIALPLVSTNGGGGIEGSAALLRELIPALESAATEYRVDIVLVLYGTTKEGQRQYAAAQAIRQARSTPAVPGTPMERLVNTVRQGRLAVFVGAGVSASAGLPSWNRLLSSLYNALPASKRGVIPLAQLETLDALRFAEYLATLYDSDELLMEEIRRAMTTDRYGLQHALLAALPVREMVTTNYDDLLERASADANRPCLAVPWDETEGANDFSYRGRRLLKLHGTLMAGSGTRNPHGPVLTLRDYIRFDERAGALAGALQGLMLSQHMLFLGFGMADPNFLRLHDGVARLLPKGIGDTPRLGTALMVEADGWKVDVANRLLRGIACHWVGTLLNPPAIGQADVAAQGHALEVFLDELVMRTAVSIEYATDQHLGKLLARDEQQMVHQLKDILTQLGLPSGGGESPLRAALREGLARLLEVPEDQPGDASRASVTRPKAGH